MTSTRKNLLVFGITFVAVALPSYLAIRQHAYGEEAFDLVLRLTARAAILVYLVVFVARPLVQLTGSALSRTLLRYRRQTGVAFSAIMLAHLLYLVWKHGFIFPVFGAVIYVFIVLMLVTSFDGPTRALGPKRWKVLHKTGLYVIGVALAQAQFGRILRGVGEPVHYVLASLFIAAVIVRVLAWNKQRVSKH